MAMSDRISRIISRNAKDRWTHFFPAVVARRFPVVSYMLTWSPLSRDARYRIVNLVDNIWNQNRTFVSSRQKRVHIIIKTIIM